MADLAEAPCRVYWGGHGCSLVRLHPAGHQCGIRGDTSYVFGPEPGQITEEDAYCSTPYAGEGEAPWTIFGEDALDPDPYRDLELRAATLDLLAAGG